MKTLLVLLIVMSLGWIPTVYADPPPWAPAHGYYKNKNKNKGAAKKVKNGRAKIEKRAGKSTTAKVSHNRYIEDGRCKREAIGKAVGVILGGVIGSEIGKDDSQAIAIIAGAVIGYVVGGSIGKAMDDRDRACVGQTLEYANDNGTVRWKNNERNINYSITPTRTYESEGNYCREYLRQTASNGNTRSAEGKACRQPDGRWRIMS